MARLVRHDATSPRLIDSTDIDEEKGDIAICRCGLSDDRPFCDGSHRATHDETADECYRYEDDDGRRRVVESVVYEDEE